MKRALLALALLAASCVNLSGFLYDSEQLSDYQLPYSDSFPAAFRVTPSVHAQAYTGSDGTVVWLVWAPQPEPAVHSAPTVVYHHGQSANMDRYWERASILWGFGANVLAYDYPSYGRTPGTPSEPTVYATARAALEFVHAQAIDQNRVFHYGFSMGSGPATQMAAFTGPTRGLILESAFTSIDALVADGTLVVPRSFLINNSFDNLSKIQRAAANTTLGVLLFHGASDTYVQTHYSIELDARIAAGEASGAVPPGRHQLFLFPGADHSNVACLPPDDSPCHPRLGDAYEMQLRAFLMR